MNSNIFLSIITVHYQDYSGLKTTLESVLPKLNQAEVEWIVVDGGSIAVSANDQEIMATVEQHAHTFVSESDSGIYDAMNKGMRLALGEYVLFLNAGDKILAEFSPLSLKTTIGHSRPDMIWGRVQFEYPDGSLGVRKLRGPKWLVYGMPVCHQSVLFLRYSFSEMDYNIRYEIAADYELLARAVHAGAEVYLVQDIISEYAKGGVSQQSRKLSLREEGSIRVDHFGMPVVLSNMLSSLKGLLWKFSDFSPVFNRLWRKRI